MNFSAKMNKDLVEWMLKQPVTISVRFIGFDFAVIQVVEVGVDYLKGYFKAMSNDSFSKDLETVNLSAIRSYRRIH